MTIAKTLYHDVAGYMEHTDMGRIVEPTWSKIVEYLIAKATDANELSRSEILCTYEDGSTILICNPIQGVHCGYLSLQQETPFAKFFPNVSKVDKRKNYISAKEYVSEKEIRQNIVNESCDDLISEVKYLQRKINAYQCHKLACRLEQYAASLRMNAIFFERLEDARRYSVKVENENTKQKENK
jgi:hypothetical protein